MVYLFLKFMMQTLNWIQIYITVQKFEVGKILLYFFKSILLTNAAFIKNLVQVVPLLNISTTGNNCFLF